jgi:hypothetical protein
MNDISRTLKIAGILLLVGGLQALSFDRFIAPVLDNAATNLARLQQEVPGNHLVNVTLEVLRDYRRISADEVRKRQALQLRQDFIQQFKDEPEEAIAEFSRVVSGFEAQSSAEQELLATLQRNLSILGEMYANHFARALEYHSSPPWFFQPAASLVTLGRSGEQSLRFNHALYLMLTGQRGTANSIFNDLRANTESDAFKSRILFAQSRLQYDAFLVQQDSEYHRQAVQHAQQSLRHNAAYDLPKLFLEYLLTIDLQAVETEGDPREGQGSGESQGERGAISNEPPEH